MQRGRYLVTSFGCADCHNRGTNNPGDPNWLAGYIPNPPAEQGRFNIGGFNTYAANLTPDKTTGLGNWTPQDIFNALRTGKDTDGHYLCPPMPWPTFRNLTDADTWAIVAYIRNLKAVTNAVPQSQGPNPHSNGHGDWTAAYQGLQPLPAYPASNETNVP